MKSLTMFQVDAFASSLFEGNPAAVILLEEWLPDAVMQSIAMENNLSETAFLLKSGNEYLIRWFTPSIEVDLCGHATLASAFILFSYYETDKDAIIFQTRHRGTLIVSEDKQQGLIRMDFPEDAPVSTEAPAGLYEALGGKPLECFTGLTDYMVVYGNESEILALTPDFGILSKLEARGVIVTAKGDGTDFVSRFFAPASGISEDPVTGSAHTMLAPYWAHRLGSQKMRALQLSQRGGELFIERSAGRVFISGRAVLYMKAEIFIRE